MALSFQTYNLIGNNFAAGGLNLKYPVTNISDNESPAAKNCHFSVTGSIIKRNGYAKINRNVALAEPITGLFQNIKSDGTEIDIVCTSSVISSSVTDPLSNIIVSGRTPTALYDFAAFLNKTFMVNGVDPNLYWDGVTVAPFVLGIDSPTTALTATDSGNPGNPNGTYKYAVTYVNADGFESNPSPYSNLVTVATNSINLTAIPVSADSQVITKNIYRTTGTGSAGTVLFLLGNITNATTVFLDDVADTDLGRLLEYDNDKPPVFSYIKQHKNGLFGVEAANPNRLRFSKRGNYSSWPALFFIDVDTNDGDTISGIYPFFDQLVIFKRKSIYILSGDDETNFSLQRANTDFRIGCIAFRSIALLNNTLAFLSERGPFIFDGLRVIYIGDKIENIFNKNSANQTIAFNWAQQSLSCASAYKRDFKNWYFLSIPVNGSTTNNLVIVYDFVTNAWQIFDGIFANSLAVFEESKVPYLYSGDYIGFIWRQDSTASDGYVQNPSFSTSNANTNFTLQDTTQTWVVNILRGVRVKITAGKGVGQIRTIIGNIANTFTIDIPWIAGQIPDTTSEYSIGFIEFEYDSRWIHYNLQDFSKRLMYFTVNTEVEGNYNLVICVRFDFDYASTFCQNLNLGAGVSLFDTALFDTALFDQTSNQVKRLTAPGGHVHRYVQFIFSNDKGNQPITINSLQLFYQQKGLRS